MKRSARVPLQLVPLVSAAFLATCERMPEQRACVDWDGRVVADANCPEPVGQTTHYTSTGGHYYRWYWYRGNDAPIIGRAAPVGGSYSGPSRGGGSHGTVRGGFGSTAAGHATGG